MTPGDAARFTALLSSFENDLDFEQEAVMQVVETIAEFMGLPKPKTLTDFATDLIDDLSENHLRLQTRA